jgi:hypothetical protein
LLRKRKEKVSSRAGIPPLMAASDWPIEINPPKRG